MTRLVAILVALLACTGIGPARADTASVAMTATVGGQDVGVATAGEPLRLVPGDTTDVVVELTNRGTQPVDVRRVDLVGRVLGLSFYSYATTVNLTIAPGAGQTLRYKLDLTGLSGQATGLIGGDLTATDSAGDVIASIATVTDVRGSLMSVYGLFGMALLVLTALALFDATLGIARHRLSANRWKRGLRLVMPGIGIGLVLAFSASIFRWWVPDTGLWVVVAGTTSAVFFAIGYFSPTPDDEEYDDEDEDEFGMYDDFDSLSDPSIDRTRRTELPR